MNSLPLFPDFAPQEMPKPSPDITRGKHGGNKQSEEANERIAPFKADMQERVRVFIAATGFAGATVKEIAQAFGVQLNQISGRITELKCAWSPESPRSQKEPRVFDSGRRRDGCAVLVSERRWAEPK